MVQNSSLNIAADSSVRTTTANNENETEEDKEENGHFDLVKTEIMINTMTSSEEAEMNICRV